MSGCETSRSEMSGCERSGYKSLGAKHPEGPDSPVQNALVRKVPGPGVKRPGVQKVLVRNILVRKSGCESSTAIMTIVTDPSCPNRVQSPGANVLITEVRVRNVRVQRVRVQNAQVRMSGYETSISDHL